MQIMGDSNKQAVRLLLLLFVVAVPTATAQGRSRIRIVQCINVSLDHILRSLDTLHSMVTTPNATAPEGSGSLSERLQSKGEDSWLMSDSVDLAEPYRFGQEEPNIDCINNIDCLALVFALDEADTIVEEVNADDIYDDLVGRIYQSNSTIAQVVVNATKDTELKDILHDNIAYLESRTETLQSGKSDVNDLEDKMKSAETVGMVLGLIALLVAFIGLTGAGFHCYQKMRKDAGVPEGLLIE